MELTAATLKRLESPPASWYLLGRARDVQDAPVPVKLLGQELVLFRSAEGIACLGARCPHMGANLANGKVRDGRLLCPFHGWEYDGGGRCQKIPGQDTIPEFAQVPACSLRERHGLVHAFRGAEPNSTLPFFDGVNPEDMVASATFRVEANCPWYLVGANGFDAQHFESIHGRTPVGEPVVDEPHARARRVVHQFHVTGSALQDRFSRLLWGKEASLSFTSWNGNVIVGTMTFSGFVSHLIIYVQPLGPSRCVADFVSYRPKASLLGRLLRPLTDAILTRVTRSFFQHEIDVLGQAHLNPARLVKSDWLLRDYMTWLVSLGEASAESPTDETLRTPPFLPSAAPAEV